ncbi:branched-chain-amino-acid aminotransferase [Venturia nashicola]|uniref:Branched-chain-amino-acid aminotransferase n=1 Tax=Venturia nashicola TaxID=86259 RepID=A0A4Z1P4E1_9PEZI|nr:branched-chain-amino-acid aminotransferase [Venturia nashicola]TLD22557.1 branched-chain-amino-acid aminotransferase [Venturia nashicola]
MAPSAIPFPVETTAHVRTDNRVLHTIQETAPSSLGKPNAIPKLAELNASLCEFTPTTSPKTVPLPDSAEQASHKVCTDHMVTVDWNTETGWQTPQLKQYGPISLMPTASCLHYATECFEGMKLYRGYDGKLRLFRPDCNAARMLKSSTRIALPAFDPEELLKLVVKLCQKDGEKWLPKERPGQFLYLRPTMIANDPFLGVQKPKEAMLYIIMCCFPNMDANEGGMKLLASKDNSVRAWPGGHGFAKVGANYGPALVAQHEARSLGYHQVLWLFGPDGEVTEAGASNFFVLWKTASGKLELVTAPLMDQTILDGVTRRSVLGLAREHLTDIEVVERKFNIGEVVDACNEGRIVEAFVCGTAFFVAGVSEIKYKDATLNIPIVDKKDGLGKNAAQLKNLLRGIMYGTNGMENHEWGYVVEEDSN